MQNQISPFYVGVVLSSVQFEEIFITRFFIQTQVSTTNIIEQFIRVSVGQIQEYFLCLANSLSKIIIICIIHEYDEEQGFTYNLYKTTFSVEMLIDSLYSSNKHHARFSFFGAMLLS